jgi:catechol 2,3-dioxygenase-like lactoylglutathione lyase family enzyme
MPNQTFILLYVDNPEASSLFYADLLGHKPIETSPTFVMFALGPSLMLGLWSRHTVKPAPTVSAGGGEIAFTSDTAAAVDATYTEWSKRGPILQTPMDMDFGRSFVALDPDGHRLRVFAPAAE